MGKIVEKEGGSMTEELRKRLRYLQHLPVTCQFEVAEIQLKHPVVSKETLNEFSGKPFLFSTFLCESCEFLVQNVIFSSRSHFCQ